MVAPFDGTVTQVADTKHAVGLEGAGGVELLIHVGMDTVEMKGEGFRTLVRVGDRVKRGRTLMTFSRRGFRRRKAAPGRITRSGKARRRRPSGQRRQESRELEAIPSPGREPGPRTGFRL